jgi:hypothetical protein
VGWFRKGVQNIAKYDHHVAVFPLTDPNLGPFRSQRHPWTSICSNHSLFPFHTCRLPHSTFSYFLSSLAFARVDHPPNPRSIVSPRFRHRDQGFPRGNTPSSSSPRRHLRDGESPLGIGIEFEHDYPQVPTTTVFSGPMKPA